MSGKPRLHVQPGDRFGRGVVLSEARIRDNRGKVTRWVRLLCDCKTVYDTRLADLLKPAKPTRSCGCLMRETAAATMSRPENIARLAAYARSPEGRAVTAMFNAATKRTHGLTRTTPLYGTWGNMMTRCYNPNFRQFKDYGGRGIAVCERWHNPQLFIEDIERLIGSRPPGLTLDRYPNNNGNYEPGNVRWATPAEQVRNSRSYKGGQAKRNPGSQRVVSQARNGSLYQTWWRLMRQRPAEVCAPWHDWIGFSGDVSKLIGPRPEGHRFHRIDNGCLYEPGNVAWVTGREQIQRAKSARWGVSRPEPKHGACRHPLYDTWQRIARLYPGELHEPWHDVRQFVAGVEVLLGSRPAGTVFRKIDPAGRYEPGNVCWGKPGRPRRK